MTAAVEHVLATPATLLVVEDDPDIQATLHDIFSMAGYDVKIVGSGAAAIEAVDQSCVDLVVLDVMLPDISGIDICEQIRQSGTDIPIVMLTALSQPVNVTGGLSAGADDYVKKPFVPDELLLRIQHLLDRYRETQIAEQEATSLRSTLTLVQQQLAVSRNQTEIETALRRKFLHNVTTHMQALYGIVEAALRKLPPSQEREVVQHIKSRVGSAVLVYQVSEALQNDPVAIDPLIKTIAMALKNMYRPWKRVQLAINSGAGNLPATIASPIALIVNELVTNCFKHAFPNNRFGQITITTAQAQDFTLVVADDGVGYDQQALMAGHGYATVTQLAQGLNGMVHWETSDTGTQVRLQIPLPSD